MKKSNPMKNPKSESATINYQSSTFISNSNYEKQQPNVADSTSTPNPNDIQSTTTSVADSLSEISTTIETTSQLSENKSDNPQTNTLDQTKSFSKEEVDKLCNEAYIRGKNEAIESYIFSDSHTRLTRNSNQNHRSQLLPGRRSVWDDVF